MLHFDILIQLKGTAHFLEIVLGLIKEVCWIKVPCLLIGTQEYPSIMLTAFDLITAMCIFWSLRAVVCVQVYTHTGCGILGFHSPSKNSLFFLGCFSSFFPLNCIVGPKSIATRIINKNAATVFLPLFLESIINTLRKREENNFTDISGFWMVS